MQANSLPKFYVGQKVVCVNPAPEVGLHKDKVYPVTDTAQCSCGKQYVSFGVSSDVKVLYSRCSSCLSFINTPKHEWYCYSTRFAPVQEQSFPLMSFQKIVEKEKEHILINN